MELVYGCSKIIALGEIRETSYITGTESKGNFQYLQTTFTLYASTMILDPNSSHMLRNEKKNLLLKTIGSCSLEFANISQQDLSSLFLDVRAIFN